MLHDDNFLSWLAKRLDYKTYRKYLIKIYDFWLDENVSIPSTDRRSGRHEVRIGKLQYIKELKPLEQISDENCKEKDVTLKKTGKLKLPSLHSVKFIREADQTTLSRIQGKYRLTSKIGKRKVMSELHVSTRVTN